MTTETEAERRMGRVHFIHGSVEGLIKLAKAEKFDMLAYLLESAKLECATVEAGLKSGIANSE